MTPADRAGRSKGVSWAPLPEIAVAAGAAALPGAAADHAWGAAEEADAGG